MIEVNAVFSKETIKQMSSGKRIGNYVIFPLLALVMLLCGIVTLIRNPEGADLVAGILLIAFCPILLFLTFYLTRSEYKNNCKSFGVDKDDVVMNYKFGKDGVLVSRTTLGRTDKETVYFRELYKVKRTKKCFMLYVNKEEMFYLPVSGFVRGTPDELFKLLYDNKVILDY